MRVTLLGTGTSTGVPVIGCPCRVCTSEDPRDQRTRTAALVEVDGLHLLIDTGPDFRTQALRERIGRVDAVLFTHHHFDHVVGADDLRPFLFSPRTPIPCYARPTTAAELRVILGYIFADGSYPGVPQLRLRPVVDPFVVESRSAFGGCVEVTPIDVHHGDCTIYGYRIGRFAYLTDVSGIPGPSFALLEDLDVLVLDALRHRPHPTHFTIEQAVEAAQQVGARRTFFLHLTHDVLHVEAEAALPDGIRLGYDGLTLDVASAP